ncbi:MAG: hypothetical protein ACLQIQ_21285 [Beijerinckiaceae bacterium]
MRPGSLVATWYTHVSRQCKDSGDLAERIDKTTGAPASANNLACSYAAFIRAYEARRRFASLE